MSNKNKTNVFHVTTNCNLDCKYCYEKRNRDQPGFIHHDSTKEEVDIFLTKTKEYEPSSTSCVVLFGGEPFLRFDTIEYIYQKAKEFGYGAFVFNITSNGIWLSDDTNASKAFSVFKDGAKNGIKTSLDISYDFSGQGLRVFKNGESSIEFVKRALRIVDSYLLIDGNKDDFEFRIRNTITPDNAKNIVRDTIYAMEKYKSITRVTHTYAFNVMNDVGYVFEDYIKTYLPYLVEIHNRYNKFVCLHTELCKYCGHCDGSGLYRYHKPNSTEEYFVEDGKNGEFNLFGHLINDREDISRAIETMEQL